MAALSDRCAQPVQVGARRSVGSSGCGVASPACEGPVLEEQLFTRTWVARMVERKPGECRRIAHPNFLPTHTNQGGVF